MRNRNFYALLLFLAPLTSLTQNARLILPVEQGINIRSANFSPDAKYFVTTQAQTIKIWETLTGRVIQNISHKTDFAAYSHNGKYILTDNGDVWNLKTGIKIIATGEDGCDFSKDDRYLLTTKVNTINLHDLNTGTVTRINHSMTGPKTWAFFSPDNKNIIAWAGKTIEIWNIERKQLITQFEESAYTRWASLSPDGLKIVTSTVDKAITIWDAVSGKKLNTLQGHSSIVATVSFSPDGRDIVSASYDKTIRIWDASKGIIKFILTAHNDRVNSAFYSPDGKWIISSSWDKSVKIWESANGRLYGNYVGSINLISNALFSPHGEKLGILTDSCLKICDPATMEIRQSFNDGVGFRQQVEFSEDANFAVTKGAVSYSPILRNLSNGKYESVIPDAKNWICQLTYSPDGKYLATSAFSGETVDISQIPSMAMKQVVQKAKGALTTAFDENSNILVLIGEETLLIEKESGIVLMKYSLLNDSTIHTLKYSSDFRFILSAGQKNAMIIDAVTGAVVTQFNDTAASYGTAFFSQNRLLVKAGDFLEILSITDGRVLHKINYRDSILFKSSLTPDQKFIMSSGLKNSLDFWDINTGQLAWSYFILFNTDFLTLLRGNTGLQYYYGTKKAVQELSFEIDGKRFPFEQLDVKHNRPDKVLEAICNTDTALIRSYRRAWEKRIKKLGIDTTAFLETFSMPDADFANRDNIESEQKKTALSLHIKGTDSTFILDRFNVWINEVPIFGQRGISTRKKNSHTIDTTLTIKLSQGENRIETSISNVNGTESYRMPLIVNYTPAIKQKETIRFIGIGIDQFADNEYNLQYSSKDIRDLSKKLKEKYKEDIIIDTLINENVTISNVKALKQKLQQTTENDKVIIAYSGHGLLSKEYDYYLSTYSINFDKPEQNGLPYDELENLLDSIPARKKLMLIDACHSGEVDKEDLVRIKGSSDSLIKGVTPVAYSGEGHLGLKNSFELMQSLFVNVGKSTGATIISAAAGTQFALERNDLKNGVFTYSILEAMKTHTLMKISELKKIVGERVEELTKGLQKPTSRNETIAVDWNLW
ncbi:MAG: caspase family protein [Bacteroidota bacterium]|nr:caspase family protein [Bacteroidota bacterium]